MQLTHIAQCHDNKVIYYIYMSQHSTYCGMMTGIWGNDEQYRKGDTLQLKKPKPSSVHRPYKALLQNYHI